MRFTCSTTSNTPSNALSVRSTLCKYIENMENSIAVAPCKSSLSKPNPLSRVFPLSFVQPSRAMYIKTLFHPLKTNFSTTVSSLDRFAPSRHSSPSSLVLSISSFSRRRNCRFAAASVNPIERNGRERDDFSEATEEFGAKESILKQMREIALFAGPALGLWICGPLMSLVDTAVIGRGSSLELAALGPGTVVCDYLSYAFMFISIATSNIVATSLAREDKNETQHQISILLFVGFTCGVGMLLLTKFLGARILTAFAGSKNLHLVPAANAYVQIRGLAWPALLIGWVAQSASLAMKDSWGPLKALVVATVVNAVGDITFCCFLGYGIAGAAWATMVSQVIAAFMMMSSLKSKGFDAFFLSIPSTIELVQIFKLAAPVFIALISKVVFFSLLTYCATSMGTMTIAGHQVMVQIYSLCTVSGEPLSQTAQSFMPRLFCGVHRSLPKARMLLNSLLIIGTITGLTIGTIGTFVPWLFPYIFTTDNEVIQQMHNVLLPFFTALVVTPLTNSVEGTLLAGRDVRFLSLSMSGCFCLGCLLLLLVSIKGFGLQSCWWAVAGFQWVRFLVALRRLISPNGLLHSSN